jgi:putative tricarboxylic transport membrane protein
MKTFHVELSILMVVGMLSIIEGIRLVMAEKLQLYDVLGPGFYNIGMGSVLILVGVIYFLSQRKSFSASPIKTASSSEYRMKMASMVGVLAAYILLLDFLGYFISSLLFFILINRIVGFQTWRSNLPVSLAMAIVFYVVFVKWLNMIFPQGIWIGPS